MLISIEVNDAGSTLNWNVHFTFLFIKIAYFCLFIKIELHYMNLFCIFAL